MLKLRGKVIEINSNPLAGSHLYRVSRSFDLPVVLRRDRALFVTGPEIPDGYSHYIFIEEYKDFLRYLPQGKSYSILANEFSYIGDNDVIRLSGHNSSIDVLFRASSKSNSLLVTEQCNHYCLMCSQPPKRVDDSWILEEIERLIPLIPRDTEELGFTGGEPTLYGDSFLKLLRLCKSYLPHTAIHILTNGRAFKDYAFAKSYSEINHQDMMVGIPIYSDDPSTHDYIVQAQGAFDETILGVLNLKKLKQKVEIRIVIHRQSIDRLVELCSYLGRNLQFVDHVALMGLEMTGFARANIDSLWIDPYEYKDTLSRAAKTLANYGLTVSVYNHPLCTVNRDILPYYRKSISDWKNEYAEVCDTCSKLTECGGFFTSNLQHKYSSYLNPFRSE